MMDAGKLFANVRFYIADCDRPDEVRNLLINESARHINYLSEHVTHVIADRACPAAEEARDLFERPVVRSYWVRVCIKTRRIWPTEAFSPYRTIFLDVVASISRDLSPNDIRMLQIYITLNGGRLSRDPERSSHFITPSTNPTELQNKLISERNFKMVSPDWVKDSIKQKSRCDEASYDPQLLLGPPTPPPPKQQTPPPPVSQPQQQQPQQQQMIETVQHKGSSRSDISTIVHPNRHNEEQARKIDSPIRAQTPSQLPQQSQQVNTMQPLSQAQMTRAPAMMPNVIRGASPRFRPLSSQATPRQQLQPTNRMITPDQQPRRASIEYNQAYRKVGPYPYNHDMQQAPQRQQQIQQSHLPSQGQPYQQVELSQIHQQGTMINQPMRMAQSNVYHQVRPSYQNSHMAPRMPIVHPNAMNSQQLQQQTVQRFQDPNSQMPQTRPYQMINPHQQQHQPTNAGYQGNMQRQPIYYNQVANTQTMRMQQPMVRGSVLSSDHMVANDPHHRVPNQLQPQQPPIYQQQQPLQRAPMQKNQPFQQPHPPTVVSVNQPQLLPNMPNSQLIRAQRNSVSNQLDSKITNAKQPNAPHSNEKASRAQRNSAAQQQPHPSIFDLKQESSYAQMKAKVPILADNVEYYNFVPEHTTPKGKPLFGCKFQLIEHDDLSPKIRQYYCDAISEAGGVFEENIEDLTHLICESQSSPIFANAVKKGVRCVTIYWINDVLGQDRLEYPWRALHIPTCYSKDDKHLRDQIISITNLKKQERQYVKDMIKKTGAKYTDYFSRKNTLLICGSPHGEKFERAIEWGIPVANCLLISDYLISGRKFDQMLDHAKYQNFNLGDQLKLDSYDLIRDLMIPWTKPIPASSEKPKSNGMPEQLLPIDTGEVSSITSNIGNNSYAIVDKTQSETAASPSKIDSVDAGNVTGGANESMQKDDLDVSNTERTKTDDVIAVGTSTTSDTPACVSISVQSESIVSGEPKSVLFIDDQKNGDSKNESNQDTKCNKKIRVSDAPVKVIFTRLKPELLARLEKYAIALGFRLASSYLDCTHLIVDRISRSPKFICAFNYATFILSYEWLVDSHDHGKPLDEMAYILQDKEGEKKFSFDLVHSMMKRKKRSSLLFHDFVFFVTPTLLKKVVNLTSMIESAGALVTGKKLPTGDQVSQLRAEGKRFVVVADKNDLYLLDSIEAYGVDIVGVEFVLSGILRQDLDFEHHRLNYSSTNGHHQKELVDTMQPSPQKKIRHI